MDKLYKLEKDNQFWEILIQTIKKDNKNVISTTIRAGKKGCKGRKYPVKTHTTFHKAQQFSRQHVNAKIIQGFDQVPSSDHITSHLSRVPTVTSLACGTSTSGPSQPSSSLQRRLSVNRVCRKPPKKQDTVRRLARQGTPLNRRTSRLSRQNTVVLETTSSNNNTQNNCNTAAKWRKPHRKQSTIRRLANAHSSLKKSSSSRKVLF